MSELSAAVLDDRTAVRVGGADAAEFLQGLVTTDIEALDEATPGFGALLTPQGKILFDFLLFAENGAFVIDCRREIAPELVKRLGFYKLRAKVDVSEADDMCVVAWWGEAAPSAIAAPRDPRLAELGWRALVPRANVADLLRQDGLTDAGVQAYHAHRIRLGVPEGGLDYSFGDVFPHEACLDQLHGVSFAKGCYVGQEVVSRMQHRGTARSRFVQAEQAGAAPPPGTAITAGGTRLGHLGSSADGHALALVRLDRAARAIARGEPITVDGAEIQLAIPAWASYSFPSADAGSDDAA